MVVSSWLFGGEIICCLIVVPLVVVLSGVSNEKSTIIGEVGNKDCDGGYQVRAEMSRA